MENAALVPEILSSHIQVCSLLFEQLSTGGFKNKDQNQLKRVQIWAVLSYIYVFFSPIVGFKTKGKECGSCSTCDLLAHIPLTENCGPAVKWGSQ